MQNSNYNQPEKNRIRALSLKTAVQKLTKYRSKNCAIPSSYVAQVKEHLQSRSKNDYDKIHSALLDNETVNRWESLQKSNVGSKVASELQIAYLCGPDPTLDFKVLTDLGVHPNNIWAFESDPILYKQAVEAIKKSTFSSVKIHHGSMSDFFEIVPKKFDIIYLDACAPITSIKQKVPELLFSIFQNQRLNSPGILLTNFSHPDESNTQLLKYTDSFTTAYLYPKSFLESHRNQSGITEGPIAHGLLPFHDDMNSEEGESDFYTEVTRDRTTYYGQLVTRMLLDLALTIVPTQRISKSPKIWNRFFNNDIEKISSELDQFRYTSEDDIGPVITDSNLFPLSWTLTQLTSTKVDLNYGNIDSQTTRYSVEILKQFTNQGVHKQILFDYLKTNGGYYTPELLNSFKTFSSIYNYYQFCDVFTESLIFDCLLSQYSYPMIPVTQQIRRWTYKAKETQMYVDLIPFDHARYVFEWLPTMDLLNEALSTKSEELCFRFALDGLARQCRYFNTGFLYGASSIDKFSYPEFSFNTLKKRKTMVK